MPVPLQSGQSTPALSLIDALGRPLILPDPQGRVSVLRFLRHLGCPICRMELSEWSARAEELGRRAASFVVLVESSEDSVAAYARERAKGYVLVGDPQRIAYSAFAVERGSVGAFLAPGAMAKAARATLKGHLHGRFEGSELQLPADFVVDGKGTIVWARYGTHIGDSASLDQLLSVVDGLSRC